MISVDIEKEINQENKIILNFNLRQMICLGGVIVFSLFVVLVLHMDISITIYPCFVVAGIAFLFGWYRPNGIPFEKILRKQIQAIIYGSNIRTYKTKNQYIVMLNTEYNRRRRQDFANKRVVRQMKKEEKQKKKKRKKERKQASFRTLR